MLRRPIRYSDKEYWDQRYTKSTSQFEWFYGANGVKKVVKHYLSKRRPCLHIGCGNSTIQEGLARRGYTVVNVDISPVVIDTMREKHKDYPTLSYLVSDCRSMPEFPDCSFGSAIDKGTLDALVCCKEADTNVRQMMSEISRVLQPGGVFLLITLGAPEHRLPMINRPEYGWSIQVCLLPKTHESKLLPHNDAPDSLDFLGPFSLGPDNTAEGLPEPFDPTQYFYCYACKKSPLELSKSKGEKARLPAAWCSATKEAVARLQQELGLPADLHLRDKRTRTMRVRAMRRDSAGFSEQSTASQESAGTGASVRSTETVQQWVCEQQQVQQQVAQHPAGPAAGRAVQSSIVPKLQMQHLASPALSKSVSSIDLAATRGPKSPTMQRLQEAPRRLSDGAIVELSDEGGGAKVEQQQQEQQLGAAAIASSLEDLHMSHHDISVAMHKRCSVEQPDRVFAENEGGGGESSSSAEESN